MTSTRQLRLGAFMRPVSIHTSAWRWPGAYPDANFNFAHLKRFAQTLERGKFDAFFMADHLAVMNMPMAALKRSATVTSFDPLTLLPALAAVTDHIGLIATASTTYNEPYHVARKFASLDHISGGRAGWNLVTSANPQEAYNFGLDQHVEHGERYHRAREFFDVVTGLWDSWADDAFIRDVDSGIYFEPSKLHVLDHRGEHLKVRVPLNIARVLRQALELNPDDRWPHATVFRRALWRTRGGKYRRRTIGLSAGALVAGAAGATWLASTWLHGTFPFRPPGSLQVVVTPFEDVCSPAARQGDRLARSLVRELQGNVDFSVAGPEAPPWFIRRSTVVVRGTMCARGDSLHVEVRGNMGARGADAAPVQARGDTSHLDRLADTLARGIVLYVWNRENPLDPALPLKALPRMRGLAAWLAAERLLAQGRWEEADRAYDAAEEVDSTCWLCAWRHADVDRWLDRRFDPARASRYFNHIDSFPAHYQVVIRASREPLVPRLAMLTRVTREHRDFLPAHFMLADDLYHRGPLIGRPREEAIEAFERVVSLRPDFLPAWEHLAWALAADGRDSAARAALGRLDASGPARDPFSAELRVLLHVGITCRFDGSAACGRISEAVLPQAAGYPDLAAGARYLMTFDAPRGAIELGRRFAAQIDGSALARSGFIAEVDGYLALGLADSARRAARRLRGAPELDVFAPELDAALLLLDPDDSSRLHTRWDEVKSELAAHAHSRASTPETRRRAAFMLLLLGSRLSGPGDPDGHARWLVGETGRRPLAVMVAADAAARRGRLDAALAATDPLTALPADSLGDPTLADPFFRTVLHLVRAGWHERRRDAASAVNELVWFENNDAFERPSGPPQVADMDWAFGTLARWRLAKLLDGTGRATPCAAYRWVAGSWAHGDDRYRARADSAASRLVALGCKGAA